MKCEKSYKRDMLKAWGMRELSKPGMKFETVVNAINKMMRKTVKEVQEFVKEK